MLDVAPTNDGTYELPSAYGKTVVAANGLSKAVAKARDPERCAKIAASRRGKKRPKHVIEAVRKAHLGTKASDETRRKMSVAQRKRGAWPPAAGEPWTEEEERLLRTLPISEVIERTGRTRTAVISRRQKLGLPDGRSHRTDRRASQVNKLAVLKRFLQAHDWDEIRKRKVYYGVKIHEWVCGCRRQYKIGVLSQWLVEEFDGLCKDWSG